MLAYYTIDWRKFHVHRRRDLRDRGVAKFDRMWFFAFIYIDYVTCVSILFTCVCRINQSWRIKKSLLVLFLQDTFKKKVHNYVHTYICITYIWYKACCFCTATSVSMVVLLFCALLGNSEMWRKRFFTLTKEFLFYSKSEQVDI